jgi:hypothetical protein
MTTLYELTGKYREILASMVSPDGEIDDRAAEELLRADGDIDEKIGSIARVIKNLQSDAEEIEAEIARLSKKRLRIRRNLDFLLGYVKEHMLLLGVRRARSGIHGIQILENQPHVEVLNEEALPDWAVKEKVGQVKLRKVDKTELLRRMKDGEIVSGATLRSDYRVKVL